MCAMEKAFRYEHDDPKAPPPAVNPLLLQFLKEVAKSETRFQMDGSMVLSSNLQGRGLWTQMLIIQPPLTFLPHKLRWRSAEIWI